MNRQAQDARKAEADREAKFYRAHSETWELCGKLHPETGEPCWLPVDHADPIDEAAGEPIKMCSWAPRHRPVLDRVTGLAFDGLIRGCDGPGSGSHMDPYTSPAPRNGLGRQARIDERRGM